MGQCGAHRSGQTEADPSTDAISTLIILVALPLKAEEAGIDVAAIGGRPIFVLHLVPYFGRNAMQADRAGIPTVGRFVARAFPRLLAGIGKPLAAILEGSSLRSVSEQPLDGFGQRRKGRTSGSAAIARSTSA